MAKGLFTLLLVALVPAVCSAQWSQIGADVDGEAAYDWSGYAIALTPTGSHLAVGARANDSANGTGAGHVRVFAWDPGTAGWVQLGDDIDGEAEHDHSGCAVDLSSDGSRVAIGAPGNDMFGESSGHVRVFEWGGSSWVQLGQDIDGLSPYDNVGGALAISADGSRLAIGAVGFDGIGSDAGAVRVYEWVPGTSSWIQLGSTIHGEEAHDFSGSAVDISSDGSRVAIGASGNDGNGTDSGHVRVFGWNDPSWVQLGSDIDGPGNYSGGSIVAISPDGSRLAVGAPLFSGTHGESGHARVFGWDGPLSDWVQLGQDIHGEADFDHFGTRVALSSDGSRLAAGAPGSDNTNGSNAGRVQVFDWDDPSWVQFGQNIDGEAEGDVSGTSLAFASGGSLLAIGAYYNDNANGDDAGHVRTYSSAIFCDGFESGGTGGWSSVTP
ncbi:MAG: WD40 repeat domain-containing protein [Thermoanaerobaculales bacterium]|jgi:hypothetical protein|nr:WD40 repeat domain-containing protein [Thermoanaerobaculales bacterium]